MRLLLVAMVVVLAVSTTTVLAETPAPPPTPAPPTSPITPAMAALFDDLAATELLLRHAREDLQKLVSEAAARESAARQQKGAK